MTWIIVGASAYIVVSLGLTVAALIIAPAIWGVYELLHHRWLPGVLGLLSGAVVAAIALGALWLLNVIEVTN